MNPDLADMFGHLRGAYPDTRERGVIESWESLFAGASAGGTLRDWMASHDGRQIDTFQFDRRTQTPWAPGVRTLDASRSTYFTLDGSRRDYAGMSVLAATDSAVAAASSDGWHLCLYYVSD